MTWVQAMYAMHDSECALGTDCGVRTLHAQRRAQEVATWLR